MSTLFAKKRSSSGRKRPRPSAGEGGGLGSAAASFSKEVVDGAASKTTKAGTGDSDVPGGAQATTSRGGKGSSENAHDVDPDLSAGASHPPAADGSRKAEVAAEGAVLEEEATFESLGLCDWLLTACKAMGFRRPTPSSDTASLRHKNSSCFVETLPALSFYPWALSFRQVLDGKDVLGCAETGSGKTAAFALPILHELSKDPYGVFAVVLTPTRELAVQISEQFGALGALMGLRHTVVIGGVGILEQSLALSGRPHVVVATPGRLRDHLQGPAAPALAKCRYLVLDEADRLLAPTFEGELRCIAEALPSSRQTLLFSATMTSNLEALETLALTNPVKYDLTKKATVPKTLTQQYLFMPQQMKTCFVVQTLNMLASDNLWSDPADRKTRKSRGRGGLHDNPEADEGQEGAGDGDGRARSVMIFVSKCRKCQELSETLLELGVDCTPLHSLLGQRRRTAALGKFKSQQTKVLISTDVASRGLDIPAVDLVINFDVPRVATDYVHRVGRTARAGRRGRAVSLVSQYDIELVHNIEQYTGTPLGLCPEVEEDDVLKLLNQVAKASRVARMRLMEQGSTSERPQSRSVTAVSESPRAKDAPTAPATAVGTRRPEREGALATPSKSRSKKKKRVAAASAEPKSGK